MDLLDFHAILKFNLRFRLFKPFTIFVATSETEKEANKLRKDFIYKYLFL